MSSHRAKPLLVFAGLATQDTIAVVERFPAADSRTLADAIVTAGGGPAATAAVAAARCGARTAFVGSVGRDEAGDRVIAELVAEGVDVSGVARVEAPTPVSVVVVNRAEDGRAILTLPPQRLHPLSSSAEQLVDEAAWVHVDHVGWNLVSGLARSGRLSVDAGNPIPNLRVQDIDLYVPTIERLRAEAVGEVTQPTDLVMTALAAGAAVVVATDGSRGSWWATADQEPTNVSILPGEIVSTLGAGDVFHGALVAAVAAGFGIGSATRIASDVATTSCSNIDGRSGIPYHSLFDASPATSARTPEKEGITR